MSRLLKSWLCNVQVCQHMVEQRKTCCQMPCAQQLVFPPLHHMLTYFHIAQPAFEQSRCFFSQFCAQLFWNYFGIITVLMDIKKECKIIEVIDLTKQVQKDAGQTIVELKAHVSLKFTICWLQPYVCLYVCL